MIERIPYERVSGAKSQDCEAPAVLDLKKLRSLWRSWIDLEPAPDQHALAGNVAWLWKNANEYSAEQFYARPWSGLTAASGLRTFVLQQCRASDQLGSDDAEQGPGFKALNDVIVSWVEGGGIRTLQGVALLNALTANAGFASLPVPDLDFHSPIDQHIAYEIARGLRARDPLDTTGFKLMGAVADSDVDPRLSLMAIVNLITLLVRFENDETRARKYLRRADQLKRTLSANGTWLDWHIVNNYHRINALLEARSGNQELAAEALAAAETADENALAAASDEYAVHVIAQSHMLLTGVKVRFETRKHGDRKDVKQEIEELERIAPWDFEQQPAIADFFVAQGDLVRAARHYRRGAQGGAVQGAIAAFKAFECSRQTGDVESASADLRLLKDLDRGADVHRYFLSLGLARY